MGANACEGLQVTQRGNRYSTVGGHLGLNTTGVCPPVRIVESSTIVGRGVDSHV